MIQNIQNNSKIINKILKLANIEFTDLQLISEYNNMYNSLIKEPLSTHLRKIAILNSIYQNYSKEGIDRLNYLLEEINPYCKSSESRRAPAWTYLEVKFLCAALCISPFNVESTLNFVTNTLSRKGNAARVMYYRSIKNNLQVLDTHTFMALNKKRLPVIKKNKLKK